MNPVKCHDPMHPPHDKQLMECDACARTWIDCPGAWGERYSNRDPTKQGCPHCYSINWRAVKMEKFS